MSCASFPRTHTSLQLRFLYSHFLPIYLDIHLFMIYGRPRTACIRMHTKCLFLLPSTSFKMETMSALQSVLLYDQHLVEANLSFFHERLTAHVCVQ